MKRGVPCLFVSFLLAVVPSCDKDEGDPSCGSKASSFTGTWNVTEQCGGNEFSYPLTLTQNTSGGITLTNLGGLGPNSVVNATINGSGSFDIFPQNVQGYTITGNGSLNGGCVQLVIQWSGTLKGACAGTGSK